MKKTILKRKFNSIEFNKRTNKNKYQTITITNEIIIPSIDWALADIFSEDEMIVLYHMGLIFRNEEEHEKYMTPEVCDLLFKL